MDIREIEQATDPADFAWRRYIADEPDYDDYELFIPTTPLNRQPHVEYKTSTYKLGSHLRTRVTKVITNRPIR
jgi:hypothetical protein